MAKGDGPKSCVFGNNSQGRWPLNNMCPATNGCGLETHIVHAKRRSCPGHGAERHTLHLPPAASPEINSSCFQAKRPYNQRLAIGGGPAAAKGPIIANALPIWGGVHTQSREAHQKAVHPNCHRCALASLKLRARVIRRRNIARRSRARLIVFALRAWLICQRNIADAHLNFNLRARLKRKNCLLSHVFR